MNLNPELRNAAAAAAIDVRRPVFRPSERVAEHLLDDTSWQNGARRQHAAERARIGERGIRYSGDFSRGVYLDIHRLAPARLARAGVDVHDFLVAPRADGIVLLEPESDGIHQPMTARARRILRMLDHALALRASRIGRRRLGQVRVHARRRVRHDLTEHVLAHEQAARGGGRLDRTRC